MSRDRGLLDRFHVDVLLDHRPGDLLDGRLVRYLVLVVLREELGLPTGRGRATRDHHSKSSSGPRWPRFLP